LRPKRVSNSCHRSGGAAADSTVRTGLSASSGRSGCFSRIEIIPPSVLNSTASYFRQSSQKREAENRSARASLASSSIEPMNEISKAFPWNSGSGV